MQIKGSPRKRRFKKSVFSKRNLKQVNLNLPREERPESARATLKGAVEALIFASGDPISAAKIAVILEISQKQAVCLVNELINSFENEEHGVMIGEVAGAYQMFTKPAYAEKVAKIAERRDTKLSAAALETLAIIAFKQPITRLEIENIRGVNVDGIVNMLLERMLIKEIGRKEALGRPILYGTTDEFLLCFGIKSLDELPPLAGLLSEADEMEDTKQ